MKIKTIDIIQFLGMIIIVPVIIYVTMVAYMMPVAIFDKELAQKILSTETFFSIYIYMGIFVLFMLSAYIIFSLYLRVQEYFDVKKINENFRKMQNNK